MEILNNINQLFGDDLIRNAVLAPDYRCPDQQRFEAETD